jgi:hypothetical protein
VRLHELGGAARPDARDRLQVLAGAVDADRVDRLRLQRADLDAVARVLLVLALDPGALALVEVPERSDQGDRGAVVERDLDHREAAVLRGPPHLLDAHLTLELITRDGVGEEGVGRLAHRARV